MAGRETLPSGKLLFLVLLADRIRLAGIGKNLLFFVRHYGREGEAEIISFRTRRPRKNLQAKAFTRTSLITTWTCFGSQLLLFSVTRVSESRWLRWWK
jgi:hypothetical protein